MSNEQSIRDEPSLNEVRADFITLHTRNFDAYMVGRSLTSEQEFYGAQFDSVIRRIQAEAIRRVALESHDVHLNTRRGTYAQGQNVIVRDMYAFLCNRADRIERGETA